MSEGLLSFKKALAGRISRLVGVAVVGIDAYLCVFRLGIDAEMACLSILGDSLSEDGSSLIAEYLTVIYSFRPTVA